MYKTWLQHVIFKKKKKKSQFHHKQWKVQKKKGKKRHLKHGQREHSKPPVDFTDPFSSFFQKMLLQKVNIKYIYRTTIYTNIEKHFKKTNKQNIGRCSSLSHTQACCTSTQGDILVTQHPLLQDIQGCFQTKSHGLLGPFIINESFERHTLQINDEIVWNNLNNINK